jgi:hypothetical protein
MWVLFEFDLRVEHLVLGFGGQVLAGRHRDRSGHGAGQGGQKYDVGVEAAADHARHEQEHGHQAVVDAEDDVAPVLARNADVGFVDGGCDSPAGSRSAMGRSYRRRVVIPGRGRANWRRAQRDVVDDHRHEQVRHRCGHQGRRGPPPLDRVRGPRLRGPVPHRDRSPR